MFNTYSGVNCLCCVMIFPLELAFNIRMLNVIQCLTSLLCCFDGLFSLLMVSGFTEIMAV